VEPGVVEGIYRRKAEADRSPVSPAGVSLVLASRSYLKGGNMWWIFGFALAVVVAAAYVLTRRPSRRTSIVVERD
jgi:hypothetical protein